MAVIVITSVLAAPLYAGGAMIVRHEPGGAALIWSAASLLIGLAWLTLHIYG